MKAMRLLHALSGNLYGGVETMLRTFADYRHGIEHQFALSFEGRLANELRALSTSVYHLGEVRTRYPLSILKARLHLRRLLRENQFDAVACHMPWAQAIFGPVVRASGLPLIFWMHDTASGRHWLEKWARFTRPDLVLCNSRYTASTLEQFYPDIACEVWYLPVPAIADIDRTATRRQVREELQTPADAVVILQASRFEAWKGHREHLAALASTADDPKWVSWIAGWAQRPDEAKYLAELRGVAERSGIAHRVRFCGQRNDIKRLMSAADIYCQPNTAAEPFGLVFAEALSAGLPVISTGLGGVAELIDNSCGLVVPPANPITLAAALEQLINDPGLRATLGQSARTRVAELCDLDRQMARLEPAIAQVLHPTVLEASAVDV